MLSKIFEILSYDGIQYLDQSNVSQFTQKLPGRDSRQGQLIWFLRKLIFKILWHNGAQYVDKSIVSQFSKKNLLLGSNMGLIWPKIVQLVLNAQEIFRNILA